MPETDQTDAAPEEELEQDDGGSKRKRQPMWIAIAVSVAAIICGGAVGAIAVGPALAGGVEESPAAAEEPEHTESGPGAVHVGAVIEFDNLVVNPAGSEGSRFLMTTVGVGVANKEISEEAHEFDVQIRDLITSVLQEQTLEMLTASGARDSLKVLLAEVIAPFFEGEFGFEVYIPHFVIQ